MGDQEPDELAAEISLEEALEQSALVSKKVVTIVVLGDIGRSPRMRFHALSLAKEGYYVHMIGYGGSELPLDLKNNTSVKITNMMEPPKQLQDLPVLIAYPAKIVWQWLFLSWAFLWVTLTQRLIPSFILVQNPPAIPTLPLVWMYSLIYRCNLLVDWHNYGYSIMALNLGAKHRITKLYELLEMYFGARGTHHICVTKAMREDLKKRIGVHASVFHDRPPEIFRSLNNNEKSEFLKNLSENYNYPSVLQTDEQNRRPGILVSSTSWTEDENFSILLTALAEYDKIRREDPATYPKLIVFITGKGPQKEYYERIINRLDLKDVEINLPWLEPEDYPKLLGCADLGVSLHTSSSGLDLPMKVVDMFGCGLPVLAVRFQCISELVRHMHNGCVFDTADELAGQIQDWFSYKGTLINKNKSTFKKNLQEFQNSRWHENWVKVVKPIFESKQ